MDDTIPLKGGLKPYEWKNWIKEKQVRIHAFIFLCSWLWMWMWLAVRSSCFEFPKPTKDSTWYHKPISVPPRKQVREKDSSLQCFLRNVWHIYAFCCPNYLSCPRQHELWIFPSTSCLPLLLTGGKILAGPSRYLKKSFMKWRRMGENHICKVGEDYERSKASIIYFLQPC